MKKRIVLPMVLFFGIGLSTLFAQSWSAAQQEVWKNVNDYWGLLAKGDVNGFLEYMHPDYLGWDNGSPVPNTKEDSKKMFTYFMTGAKIPYYEIKPLGIAIFGDVAIVHYYYSFVQDMPDGKKRSEKGRWTDILMKQGARWVMIGDHGGTDKEE